MTNNELILKEMEFQYLTSPGLQMTAEVTTLGVSFNNSDSFVGACLASNNAIYSLTAGTQNTVLTISEAGVAAKTAPNPAFSSAGNTIMGCALAYGGQIIGVTSSGTGFYVIDPINGTTSTTASVYEAGTLKWWGGISGKNGKTIFVPYNATDVAILDTYNGSNGAAAGTRTRSAFGLTLTGTSKWIGAVMGIDDWAYCCPVDATDVLMIEMANRNVQVAKRTNFGLDLSGAGKFAGGVTAGDGKIYMIPLNADYVLVIDPRTGTAEKKNYGLNLSAAGKWYGGVNGPDGKIYCCPFDARDFLIIDPFKQTAVRSTLGATTLPNLAPGFPGGHRWAGGACDTNGNIYFFPNNPSSSFIVIRPKWPGGHERALLASPYFNHS